MILIEKNIKMIVEKKISPLFQKKITAAVQEVAATRQQLDVFKNNLRIVERQYKVSFSHFVDLMEIILTDLPEDDFKKLINSQNLKIQIEDGKLILNTNESDASV